LTSEGLLMPSSTKMGSHCITHWCPLGHFVLEDVLLFSSWKSTWWRSPHASRCRWKKASMQSMRTSITDTRSYHL